VTPCSDVYPTASLHGVTTQKTSVDLKILEVPGIHRDR